MNLWYIQKLSNKLYESENKNRNLNFKLYFNSFANMNTNNIKGKHFYFLLGLIVVDLRLFTFFSKYIEFTHKFNLFNVFKLQSIKI